VAVQIGELLILARMVMPRSRSRSLESMTRSMAASLVRISLRASTATANSLRKGETCHQ